MRYSVALLMGCLLMATVPCIAYAQQEEKAVHIRFCKNDGEINRLWQLTRLHEEPSGSYQEEKKNKPFQYMWFQDNGVFIENKRSSPYVSRKSAQDDLYKVSGSDVWQFVVGEQGVIYFYKNQVFSHSAYCGMVTSSSKYYRRGHIVITPTEVESGSIYQIYRPFRDRKLQKSK